MIVVGNLKMQPVVPVYAGSEEPNSIITIYKAASPSDHADVSPYSQETPAVDGMMCS